MSSQEFRRGNNLRGARGSRRARGGWRSHASTPQQPPRANEPFGPRIDSFNVKTLLIEEEGPEIEDVKYMGSYNWLNDSSPVILIPGQSFYSHRCPSSKGRLEQHPVFSRMCHVLTSNTARFPTSMDSVGRRHQAAT